MPAPSSPFDIVALLRADVESLPPEARPACLAALERGSARRYRDWADASNDPQLAAGLRVCAAREDGIADMIEAGFTTPAAHAPAVKEVLGRIARKLGARADGQPFLGLLADQAAAERGGARTWRDLAPLATTDAERWTLDVCARLESESAEFLDAAIRRLESQAPAR